MLTILGFAMIATFLVLIMMKKMSPIAALVLIPALFCVLVGKGAHLGDYVIDGVSSLAPTAAMLMFAIVYFGVMIDVGLFDPIVRAILKFCKADPMRIVVGTALLAAIVSLDGDGSTTFMITVSAMYPLYKRLKMSLVVMTGVAAMANGVMNTLPWGGPTARAATALKVDATDIFVPMIPALAVGLVAVVVLAYVLGLRERRRLGTLSLDGAPEREPETETVLVGAGAGTGRPGFPVRVRVRVRVRLAARRAAPVRRATGTPGPAASPTTTSRASTRTGPPCGPGCTGSTRCSPSRCSPP